MIMEWFMKSKKGTRNQRELEPSLSRVEKSGNFQSKKGVTRPKRSGNGSIFCVLREGEVEPKLHSLTRRNSCERKFAGNR